MQHLNDDALLSAALGGPSASQASEHLGGCALCSATVNDLRLGAQLVRDARGSASLAEIPPAELRSKVMASYNNSAVNAGLPRSPWRTIVTTALAAAVGVAVGIGIGALALRDNTPELVVATAELAPLADDAAPADARIVDTRDGLVLVVEAPEFNPQSTDYFEVWLINDDLQRMISVGVLNTQGEHHFPVTQDLLDEGYRIVDISRELFDDLPTHSGDSLVRGELAD